MIDNVFIFYLAFLSLFTLLGISLRARKEKKEAKENQEIQVKNMRKKHVKKSFCPCVRMVESSFGVKICTYSGVGGFLYSSISLSQLIVSKEIFIILGLSLFCVYLGWAIRKD